jgi:RNA polymerase sigma factor (sigma-70 family)
MHAGCARPAASVHAERAPLGIHCAHQSCYTVVACKKDALAVRASGMGYPSGCQIDRDAVLLRRWVSGDQSAARQLIALHEPEVSRFFNAQQPADAQDLTQETLLAILEARERFRGEASFRTFLLRIARYKLWAHRRRRHGSHVDWEDAESDLYQRDGAEQEPRAYDLERALERLPPALSRVITLSFEKQLTRRAIAEELGIPPGTVASRIRNAKLRLRELMVAEEQ